MAGRTRGVANKNKKFLLNRLQDMYGDDFHPLMKIAENCVQLQARADQLKDEALPEVHFEALQEANKEWARMAEYTEPKLKAVEVSSGEGGLVVNLQSKDGDL